MEKGWVGVKIFTPKPPKGGLPCFAEIILLRGGTSPLQGI